MALRAKRIESCSVCSVVLRLSSVLKSKLLPLAGSPTMRVRGRLLHAILR
jgi:hypothetical protein